MGAKRRLKQAVKKIVADDTFLGGLVLIVEGLSKVIIKAIQKTTK